MHCLQDDRRVTALDAFSYQQSIFQPQECKSKQTVLNAEVCDVFLAGAYLTETLRFVINRTAVEIMPIGRTN